MAAVSTTSKILVVDDESLLESLINQKFKSQIKSNELEFAFAHNGVEALKILEQDQDIDIILIDINMPIMDGLTLLQELLKENRIFRLIIVTAYGDMSNIRKAMNMGANDFLTKPIDLDELERTIMRNLERLHTLRSAVSAHKELLEWSKEIEIAKNIQLQQLPVDFSAYPVGARVEIYGKTILTENMGGNFFDFFPLENDHVGFFIGEVADRGIPSALFMTMTRTLLHVFALKNFSPAVCFEKINKLLLSKEIAFAIFVSAFYGILNVKTGTVRYCNAGHRPALMLSKEGGIKEIGRYEGIPLAVTDDLDAIHVKFEEKSFQFEPGSCLVLYTNGVPETQNISREMYGENRVRDSLGHFSDLSAINTVKNLQDDLIKFSNGVPQMNDVTLFAIRYNGDSHASSL